jgi:hypothetical protein
MKRNADEVLSEFSAARIPFEQFAAGPDWRLLPFLIQLAVLHLRRAEEQPMPETQIEEPDDPACLTPALVPATEESHPALVSTRVRSRRGHQCLLRHGAPGTS